jgi:hypothetical protein
MSGINKKIDEFVRSEHRTYISTVVVVLVVSLYFFWFQSPVTGPTQEVNGVVTQLIGLPSYYTSERLYLLVELDSGEKVRVRLSSSIVYRKGHRVRLLMQKPRFFGITEYRFQGYFDGDA